MANFYKNISGHTINVPLFGVGVVHVPADAACIELEKHLADAINDMARPNVILEEVFPTITVETAPIVTKAGKKTTKTVVVDPAEDTPVTEQTEAEKPTVETEIEDVTL